MSAEAMGWVFRHSPFEGVTFAVHLAMADSVNDQHGQLFWMSVENAATKARVSERSVQRSLRELEATGLVSRVRFSTQHSPAVYRFLFPDIAVKYESRAGGDTVSPLESGVTPATSRGDKKRVQGRQGDTQTQGNPREPKRQATNPRGGEETRTQPSTPMSKEELDAIDHVADPVTPEKIRELRESFRPGRSEAS